MRVNNAKLTNAINKIKVVASDVKNAPGVLFNISENLLKICYNDQHKAIIEELEVETEPTDLFKSIVFEYEPLVRAIDACQSSGIIKTSDINISFQDGKNIAEISVDQNYFMNNEEGEVVNVRKVATKRMNLTWLEPNTNAKTSILSRMDYDSIFKAEDDDGNTIDFDVMDKKVVLRALEKTTTEQGRQIYFSPKSQTVFVGNKAYLVSVMLPKNVLSEDDKNEIAGALKENNTYTEETFLAACQNKQNVLHFSISTSQAIAKAVLAILNKTSSDTINIYTKNKYCYMFIDDEGEKVGLWMEMATPNKAHIGAYQRYSDLSYHNYQIVFMREFLSDMIKSAISAGGKADKALLKFDTTEDNSNYPAFDMIIDIGNTASSVSDNYRIHPEDITDLSNNIQGRTFTISLSVLNDMLLKLNTKLIALDFNVATDGSIAMRASEIDEEKLYNSLQDVRKAVPAYYAQRGEEFDEAKSPTPVELKLQYLRNDDICNLKEYAMLANS